MDAPLFKWWHLGLALVEDKAKPKRKKGKKKHKRELAENNGGGGGGGGGGEVCLQAKNKRDSKRKTKPPM